MKREFFSIVATLAAGAVWAIAPTIDNVTALTPVGEGSDAFVFSYTLHNEPAVVTVDIQSREGGDWQSLGGAKTGFLNGEANKVVRVLDQPSKVYWFPREGFANVTKTAEYRAVVKAWSTNCPPNYMVVNLTGAKNLVRWYATTNDFPGGFSDISYKTTKLVLRKVPCAGITWLRGSPRSLETPGNDTTNNPAHFVKFTQDYYMAIYETTQKQQYLLGDTWDGYANKRDDNPVGRMGYGTIRGPDTKAGIVGDVTTGTPIDNLRKISGIADFDLPTTALFECAARAGSSTYLPNDEEWTKANLRKYAVISDDKTGVANGGYWPVGSKLPNAWGFYDMQGNMNERLKELMGINNGSARQYLASFHATLASDWATGGVTVDPQSPDNNSGRGALASGAWNEAFTSDPTLCTHALGIMTDSSPSWTERAATAADYIGYRVCCSVPAAVK